MTASRAADSQYIYLDFFHVLKIKLYVILYTCTLVHIILRFLRFADVFFLYAVAIVATIVAIVFLVLVRET